MRRVVVTGLGGLSPIGCDWPSVSASIRAGRTGVRHMAEWDEITGLNSRLGAPVDGFDLPRHYPRKLRRTMGRVSLLAVRASELALEDAGLIGDPVLRSGRAGVAYGSSAGSVDSIREFGAMLYSNSTDQIGANTYIRMMPHATAASIGLFFGLTGRLLPSSSACTSGSLAIGLGYETIRGGVQDVMVVGGSEELSAPGVAVFDTLFATSTRNAAPGSTPRPFDVDRDGLVVGEGAATLVLEDLERATARGATIHAEVVGFGTNSDGNHPTQPSADTMARAMELALEDAGLGREDIGYVNAHGTATELGDIAEAAATFQVLGSKVPISSLKSYLGHTLGACGSLEAWITVLMAREGWLAPTVNLERVDSRCADLDYLTGGTAPFAGTHVMSNNFAFGGVNTSLIFRLPG